MKNQIRQLLLLECMERVYLKTFAIPDPSALEWVCDEYYLWHIGLDMIGFPRNIDKEDAPNGFVFCRDYLADEWYSTHTAMPPTRVVRQYDRLEYENTLESKLILEMIDLHIDWLYCQYEIWQLENTENLLSLIDGSRTGN